MPDTPEHPVTVGDLLVKLQNFGIRQATIADLVSALRAEGVGIVADISHPDIVMGQYRVYPEVDDWNNFEIPSGRYLVIPIAEDETPKDPWDYDP